jgi:hypothetical protein
MSVLVRAFVWCETLTGSAAQFNNLLWFSLLLHPLQPRCADFGGGVHSTQYTVHSTQGEIR